MASKFLAAAAAAILASAGASAQTMDVAGVWLTQDQTSKIEIADCGDGTPCGRIAWIDPEAQSDVTTDIHNPNAALRGRPILGLTLLSGFEARRDGWRRGEIYNPETGRTYGSRLKLMDDGNLQLKGCLGPICQTQVWTPSSLDGQAVATAG